eukprot:4469576-Amphidinium_carterae.2
MRNRQRGVARMKCKKQANNTQASARDASARKSQRGVGQADEGADVSTPVPGKCQCCQGAGQTHIQGETNANRNCKVVAITGHGNGTNIDGEALGVSARGAIKASTEQVTQLRVFWVLLLFVVVQRLFNGDRCSRSGK